MKLLAWLWLRWAYVPSFWAWPCRPWNGFWLLLVLGRRWWLTRQSQMTLTVPVIVIGNITVGGSGKTPVVIALTQALTQSGYRVGILTRGYGVSIRQPVLVDSHQSATTVGDEAWLMAQKTQQPVMVGANRVKAYQQLIQSHALDVILSDDGLQHYQMPRTLEVLMINAKKGWGNGCALPFGPLRELPSRMKSVDFVLSNHGMWPGAQPVKNTLNPMVKHFKRAQMRSLETFKGRPVYAVAGIGFPDIFFQSLMDKGLTILPYPLPDHAPLALEQLQSWEKYPILMTEKDAVKCQAWSEEYDIWVVSLQTQLPDHWVDALIVALEEKRDRS